jgi:hypothetical protein
VKNEEYLPKYAENLNSNYKDTTVIIQACTE